MNRPRSMHASEDGTYRPGVDIGGTFTDLILLGADGDVHLKKVDTRSEAFENAVLRDIGQRVAEASISHRTNTEVRHATTVSTNAVTQSLGPPIGLITTTGFRDVLEIRRLRKPDLDPLWIKPVPLAHRRLRLKVHERIDGQGGVIEPLDIEDAERALDTLVSMGVQALAICLNARPCGVPGPFTETRDCS